MSKDGHGVKADQISKALMSFLMQPYCYVMPNVFIGRWERDVVRIDRKSGWWAEYEIKISRADLRNDLKKGYALWDDPTFVSKHGQLTAGDAQCPNRFFFVVPRGLVDTKEIPPYAGLLYFDAERSETPWAQFELQQAGKIIHRTKCTDEFKIDLLEKSYFRYHDIRNKWEHARWQLQQKEIRAINLAKQYE